MALIVFAQGGGEGAYDTDRKLVEYLRGNLSETYDIRYPQMPNEGDPSYDKFIEKIEPALSSIQEKPILIGHSLGSCFILKYLSEQGPAAPVKAIFLTATPYWGGEGWQYEGFRLATNFAGKLPKVPLFFYHAKDDEIVPFAHLELYAKDLPDAIFRRRESGGHQLDNNLFDVVLDIESL